MLIYKEFPNSGTAEYWYDFKKGIQESNGGRKFLSPLSLEYGCFS